MQRTIQIADLEYPRETLTIQSLLQMPEPRWQHLRNEITLRWKSDPGNPLARCRLCEGPVYIRVQVIADERRSLFAHYQDETTNCPWHKGEPLRADDPRASQYNGQQESALHRWLCRTIANSVSADPRCRSLAVETYLRPSIADRGRYPDVYFELDGLGKFAVEVQLSKPFPPEIAARQIHYDREGVNLLWVFRDLPDELPQGFRDVVAMQRGNPFIFDDGALARSVKNGTLVLSCKLSRDGKKFSKARYVTFDDLNLNGRRGVFLEDTWSEGLLTYCEQGRQKWLPLLRAARSDPAKQLDKRLYMPAWDSIRMFVPEILIWKSEEHAAKRYNAVERFIELILVLFSIAKSAKEGEDTLFTSRLSGKGALLALLNARLSGRDFCAFASLVNEMVQNTASNSIAETDSFKRACSTAIAAEPFQVRQMHPIWSAAKRIFPEVLDGSYRAEMDDLGILPQWAQSITHR